MAKNFQEINEEIRAEIRAAYPGIYNFDRATTAKIIGVSVGYIANLESDGTPLIGDVHSGRKPQYQFSDIVAYIQKQRGKEHKEEEEESKATHRGPRTKAEKLDGRVK